MYSVKYGHINFEENSTTEFNNNIAIYYGGALTVSPAMYLLMSFLL